MQADITSFALGTRAAPTWRHRRFLAVALLVVLGSHLAILFAWGSGARVETSTGAGNSATPRPLQTRRLVMSPPPPSTSPADTAATVPTPRVLPNPGRSSVRPASVSPALGNEGVPNAAAQGLVAPATEPPALAQASSEASPLAAPDGANELAAPVPIYATQYAPAAVLYFNHQRGQAAGQAMLEWQPAGSGEGQYTLSLLAKSFGLPPRGTKSTGHFDAAGLAPLRYAETRGPREVRATNFRRDIDKISYSAQNAEHDLPPGTQDRSSWWLHLGAILQANPALAQPGASITITVVGTRGAPEPWRFEVVERAPLTLAAGGQVVAEAVHLLREPLRPYDTRARIWLDPQRHHLPLRVRLELAATGEGQEYVLRELVLP